MPDLPYATVVPQWQDAGFVGRVQVAMLLAVTTKLYSGDPSNQSLQVIAEDKLARQIIEAPTQWSPLFAYKVAVQLIGNSSLLDTTVTTDRALFSAAEFVFDAFLPQL